MMISTKGRYALRMLVDMAEHERGGGYVPLKEIAARQEISEKYLESIVKLLVQNNVLIGVRGKGGGYRLNGTPDQFTVRRILEITEGSLAPVACLFASRTSLRADGELPNLPHVAGAQQADLRLSGQLYPRGFDEKRRRGV